MSNQDLLAFHKDLSERINVHLGSLDAQRIRLENLTTSTRTNERLKLRTLEYLKTILADHVIFYDFLLEIENCDGDFLLLNDLLDLEDSE
ncbi:MAG: hypothetical protein NTX22_06595 [Ignavibacteriales bacterium]|nr:hypothetical protein [Ignavibacteriales bacterium]